MASNIIMSYRTDFDFKTGLVYMGALSVHDLDHVGILREENQHIARIHNKPGANGSLKTDKIRLRLVAGDKQLIRGADADPLPARQKHVYVSILGMPLPLGFFGSNRFITEAVDKKEVTVYNVAARSSQKSSLQSRFLTASPGGSFSLN